MDSERTDTGHIPSVYRASPFGVLTMFPVLAETAGFLLLQKLHWKETTPTKESLRCFSKGRLLEACFPRLCGWCWPSRGIHTRAGLAYGSTGVSSSAPVGCSELAFLLSC